MKKLLILLVAFNINANAQLIGITTSQINRSTVPVTEIDHSFQYEKDYFSAYLLPISEKANLQSALDTYGSVRLEQGDYSGTTINMSGDMKLYGHPRVTTVPDIVINNDAEGLLISSISNNSITISSGTRVEKCTFISVKHSIFTSVGGIIEDNVFLDNSRTRIMWDMSSSGYFRNNKIIRSWTHAYSNQLVMKGNSTNPSYGNTFLFTNVLTPGGNSTEFSNIQDLRFVGFDAETWNYNGTGDRAMFYMRDMGNVKIGVPSGGHNGPYKTPVFDIEADNLFIIGRHLGVWNDVSSIARANTNVFLVHSDDDPYTLESGTGYDFRAFYKGNNVTYNGGSNITSAITGETASKLKATILDEKLTPWERPVWETLPNPLGDNWEEDREGKEDSTAYIQNLIDTYDYVDLPEGIYYLSSSINLKEDQGIIGAGSGKTVIVGMTDDFPLIKVVGQHAAGGFTLAHLTLQGGHTGLEMTKVEEDVTFQINNCNIKYVVFRDQTYGMHLYEVWGLDNNFIDHVSFVNCETGFKQTPPTVWGGTETNTMTYVDKTVFYKSQIINCGVGFDMQAQRPDNLNAWIDCKFENNGTATILLNHNFPFFANCDFTGHSGTYTVVAGVYPAFYSCNFYNNDTTRIIDTSIVYVEGSNFLDNIPVFVDGANPYVLNSTLVGEIGGITNGMLINSNMQSNSNLNKLMVKVVSSTPTTLLDEEPDPYPQLLVKH